MSGRKLDGRRMEVRQKSNSLMDVGRKSDDLTDVKQKSDGRRMSRAQPLLLRWWMAAVHCSSW